MSGNLAAPLPSLYHHHVFIGLTQNCSVRSFRGDQDETLLAASSSEFTHTTTMRHAILKQILRR